MSLPGDENPNPQWQQPSPPPQWGQPQEQQQPPPNQWQQQPGWQPAPPTPGAAIASLILGISGFIVCPLICSVLAVVFGHKAKNEIDASGGRLGGRGVAMSGLILGWVGIGLCVLFILLVVVIAVGSSATSGG